MADKATFDKFNLALLYPEDRARLGIKLDDQAARELLLDRVRAIGYYSGWTPDFTPSKKRRKRVRGPHRGRRTIIGWVMFAVAAGATGAIVYYSGSGYAETDPNSLGGHLLDLIVWCQKQVADFFDAIG